MGFNTMDRYNDEKVAHIWAVAKNGLVPVRKYEVTKETAKTFVLEDGTVVRKSEMRNNYQMFFTNEESAQIVHRNLRKAFDPCDCAQTSNFDVITSATRNTLPDILHNMIQELCKSNMPTREEIACWLMKESSCIVT